YVFSSWLHARGLRQLPQTESLSSCLPAKKRCFFQFLHHFLVCLGLRLSDTFYNGSDCCMAYLDCCPFIKHSCNLTIITFVGQFCHLHFDERAVPLVFPDAQQLIKGIVGFPIF